MFATSLIRRSAALTCLPFTYLHSRLAPGIRILMYHRISAAPQFDQLSVSPARFAAHMQYLAAHCEVISLAQAVAQLPLRSRRQKIVITFDDGYLDNLRHALLVLTQYQLPASIFITTEFCDQSLRHPRYPASAERLHLNWSEVRELASSPLITIGSHTLSHPYLSRLDADQAALEITQSRSRIQAEINQPVDFFCYPSGDVTPREQRLVQQAGYTAAVTVAPGRNHAQTPLHALHRTEITDRDTRIDLVLKRAGAYDPLHALLHQRRQQKFAAAAQSAKNSTGPSK